MITSNSPTEYTFSGFSEQLVRAYAALAVRRHGKTKRFPDGEWFADLEGFRGPWATGETPIDALDELNDVVFDWALFKMRDGDGDLPVVDEIDLNRFGALGSVVDDLFTRLRSECYGDWEPEGA